MRLLRDSKLLWPWESRSRTILLQRIPDTASTMLAPETERHQDNDTDPKGLRHSSEGQRSSRRRSAARTKMSRIGFSPAICAVRHIF